MTVLVNHFHGQLYQTTKSREEVDRIIERLASGRVGGTDIRWATRVRSELCGIEDCTCARNEIGERDI